ncbi:MAG: TrkA family potassium uptake protein [Acidimicrobiia bacterium]
MRALIVGCGRVGSGLAYALEVEQHDVTVIDDDPRSIDRLGKGFRGTSIVGDALDSDVLQTAGVDRVDALAAITGNDEVNAVVARLALRRFRVPRVVARMYEPRQADLYRRLGVLTISPVEWGIARLSHLLTSSDVAPITSIGSGRVHLLEITISSGMSGKRAGELEIPGEIRVVSVQRGGRTFLSDRNTPLEHGDLVSIAVVQGSESRLQQLLGLE